MNRETLCVTTGAPVVDDGQRTALGDRGLSPAQGRVPGAHLRTGLPIRDGTGRVVGAVEVFSDNSRIAAMTDLNKELQQLSLLDHSTEVGNRRFLEQQLMARLNEQDRYGWRVGVLFVDVDNLKEINDRNDHIVGDRVIRMVARTLVNGIRSFDTVGRWGGDEFVVLIVNVDERQLTTSERSSVASSKVPDSPKGEIRSMSPFPSGESWRQRRKPRGGHSASRPTYAREQDRRT